MIPATYVFLTFYSLINLNVINWGTREAVAKALGDEERKMNVIERWLHRQAQRDTFKRIFGFFRRRRDGQNKSDETLRALG